MSGASICKSCVNCIMGSCLRSTTNDSGCYVLKNNNMSKQYNRPRSASVNVESWNGSHTKRYVGMWKSWETICKNIKLVSTSSNDAVSDKNASNAYLCRKRLERRLSHEPSSKSRNVDGVQSLSPSGNQDNKSRGSTVTLNEQLSYTSDSEHETFENSSTHLESHDTNLEVAKSSTDITGNPGNRNGMSIFEDNSKTVIRNASSSKSNCSGTSANYPENRAGSHTSFVECSQIQLSDPFLKYSPDSGSDNNTPKECNKNLTIRGDIGERLSRPNVSENNGVVRKSTRYVASRKRPDCSEVPPSETNEELLHNILPLDESATSESSSQKGENFQNTKKMTAEVQFHTPSTLNFGRDTLDDSNRYLNTHLQTLSDRLKTFKNWPNKRVAAKKLAEAGFFYCGRGDLVECFVCGIKGHNWVEHDNPMEDHLRWNRNCQFVRENTTESDNTQPRQGRDICGNLGVDVLPSSKVGDNNLPEASLESLGIQKTKGPTHPDQIIYETRLATFQNWPKSLKQKPAELAAAGFYYLGVGDQTLCFYCGGGLKDWVEEDDPWEQHALWFPKCNYLLLKKSPAFVDEIHQKHASCKKEDSELEASSSSSNTKETQIAVSGKDEEKKSEDSSTICKICFKNELGVVFLPCGHIVACTDCASALKECAICRKTIQATVRAFLS